ncbi:hypothetical protein [Streptomyces sp. BA2]|uniref:hypothetical protein n=1 Tax=Streptomyces sp. BA2 TaxID=436595 RepID=UPI00192081F2
MCFVPLGTAATSGVAAEETGMASGVTGPGRGPGALADGYATAFGVAAALLVAAAVATAVLHRAPARPRPAETYARENSSKNLGDDVDPGVSRSTHG